MRLREERGFTANVATSFQTCRMSAQRPGPQRRAASDSHVRNVIRISDTRVRSQEQRELQFLRHHDR